MIREVATDQEIHRCWPLMRQLRPHLEEARFDSLVRRQMEGGYRLAALESEGSVAAVAGFRMLENLVSGRVLTISSFHFRLPL